MEHQILLRSASGLRHLRWVREVLGTLMGFALLEEHFTEAQLSVLQTETAKLTDIVAALSAKVKPYRDFLERKRTLARGKLRAAEYGLSNGEGLVELPEPTPSERFKTRAIDELMEGIEPERKRLRIELERAIDETREGLFVMDQRLAEVVSPAFVDALYPVLTPDGTRVLDVGDPNDDASGSGDE